MSIREKKRVILPPASLGNYYEFNRKMVIKCVCSRQNENKNKRSLIGQWNRPLRSPRPSPINVNNIYLWAPNWAPINHILITNFRLLWTIHIQCLFIKRLYHALFVSGQMNALAQNIAKKKKIKHQKFYLNYRWHWIVFVVVVWQHLVAVDRLATKNWPLQNRCWMFVELGVYPMPYHK